MQWSLVKSWAKSHGYTSFREKTTDPNNPNKYDYYWGKIDDPAVTGYSISVSKLATDIYNHITDNKFVEHQKQYREEKAKEDVDHSEYMGGW